MGMKCDTRSEDPEYEMRGEKNSVGCYKVN